jgi:hypothetical protein
MRDPALDLLERQRGPAGISDLRWSILKAESRHGIFLCDDLQFVTLKHRVQEGAVWRETRHHDDEVQCRG